jgi:hypothetical protein
MKTIPKEVAALIPVDQLKVTKENVEVYQDALQRLEETLKNCPKIGETDNLKKHPAIFHYFFGGSDIYICEYDGDNLMFGYAILNGDLFNSEWGYFNRNELTDSQYMNIDYYFWEETIEMALYKKYPKHFKKPDSLK